MRTWLCIAWLATAAAAVGRQAPLSDWIDPATGHRIVRLTTETGGSTLYFHDNAFSPDGDTLIVNTPAGIAKMDVAAIGTAGARLTIAVPGARGGYLARRARDIYSGGRGGPIVATNLDTGKTREVAYARGVINADETLSVAKNGTAADPEGKYPRRPVRPAVPQLQRMFPGKTMEDLTPDQRYSVTKEDGLAARALNHGSIFCVCRRTARWRVSAWSTCRRTTT